MCYHDWLYEGSGPHACMINISLTELSLQSDFIIQGSFHVPPPNLLNNKNAFPLYVQALDIGRNKSRFVQNFSFATEKTWHHIMASHSRETEATTGMSRTRVSLSGRELTSLRPWGTTSAKATPRKKRGVHIKWWQSEWITMKQKPPGRTQVWLGSGVLT